MSSIGYVDGDEPIQTVLVPGEAITWTGDEFAPPRDVTPDAIEEKYVAGEARIVVEQARYPLKQIPELLASADYNLQPDFQRRPRWSPAKQSRLIESFIINVPVPPVFLYESEYSRYEVMDGKQRLTAINDFYQGKLALTGLTEWPELNGLTYQQLPEQLRRGIDRRYLSSIVLLHETAKSADQAERLKQLVFERINTGGEDLSAQEKRNALYPGRMNSACITLSRFAHFTDMWGIPGPTAGEGEPGWEPPKDLAENNLYKSMEDVELVLRFFAHRQRRTLWRSGTRLDDYLTQYQQEGNRFSEETIADLSEVFRQTATLCHEVLGDEAFWLYRERQGEFVWVGRPTLIAYDPLMWSFSQMLEHGDTLRQRQDAVEESLTTLYVEHYEAFDGRKTNLADIARRDDLTLRVLREVAQ